ncbi:MAG: type IV pilus assembly protein PilB [Gammaproteobacteria bacterium]|nr:MAG: type IV pilus assembly protein PilB [Gammaproteobacteria bacterium]TND03664.1 MAG: type IV pilus assembly protein PilB [Gammaproteobacteria bacterium]
MVTTAANKDKSVLSGLARCLVQDGLLNEEAALRANDEAQKAKLPLVSYLVEHKILDSYSIAESASREFGIPLFDVNAMDLDLLQTKRVDEKLIRKHHALPLFKRGNRLFIAVSDPANLQALDEIKFNTGLNTEAILVPVDKLAAAIEKALDAGEGGGMDDLSGDDDLDNLEVTAGEEDLKDDATDSEIDDTPIVRFVNKILLDSIKRGASDVHFEPYEKMYRVRYRMDGILQQVASPPVALANKIASRIKIMSRLDISERRVPQDGRMKMTLSKNRAIDFRVSSCPTLFGEKICVRLLDPTSAQMGIEALGFEDEQRDLLLKVLHQPYGMVLVTGPTGSGKTVTLYTGLNILNTADRNISTAEDPAEINLPGVNQVNVNEKAGLTFAKALKAFLRQDPDIIMVGEIRDIETAEIAIKAAQTGHMVLSTLHTNDAPQTLQRLANMGVAPFNIASSVSLIIAQRLSRRLCKHCKKPVDIPAEALLRAGFTEEQVKKGLKVYGPVGCDQCNGGYKGRVGMYQVMPISETTARLIMEGANSLEIGDQARKEGISDLRQSGLKKVAQGVTSLEELNRVITE